MAFYFATVTNEILQHKSTTMYLHTLLSCNEIPEPSLKVVKHPCHTHKGPRANYFTNCGLIHRKNTFRTSTADDNVVNQVPL